jgi:3-hydroxybutyryl-CoA dehydrogenase
VVENKRNVVVVGGGTMGADVAVVFLRAGHVVTVVETQATRRGALPAYIGAQLHELGRGVAVQNLRVTADLDATHWSDTDTVVECIPEQLPLKQQLFGQLVARCPVHTWLLSNSSSFPIGQIGQNLPTQNRMAGLHFFMPAHLVPLVEVVMGPHTPPEMAQELAVVMRHCGAVPVLVRKDKPGFLANRLQHALAREAFSLIDEGVASPEDVDAAVRFGFGFRFLAAGPVLQRDHAGIEVHCAAAATMYPSLARNETPARVLRDRVEQGQLGMKSGRGFFSWTPDTIRAERARYDGLLRAGLDLLAPELPPLPPVDQLVPTQG